jgi:ribA/ribD-fused uncharacterized protein
MKTFKDYLKIYDKYIFFYNGFLSNWADTPFIDLETKVSYNCSEQYMMHQKALLFRDIETAKAIMLEKHPREQKALGRTVKNFDAGIWNLYARSMVYDGCFYKFTQNQQAREYLLSTKDHYLVEASPYDTIWGIGLAEGDELVKDPKNWKGTNWLGQVLTQLREDLIKS